MISGLFKKIQQISNCLNALSPLIFISWPLYTNNSPQIKIQIAYIHSQKNTHKKGSFSPFLSSLVVFPSSTIYIPTGTLPSRSQPLCILMKYARGLAVGTWLFLIPLRMPSPLNSRPPSISPTFVVEKRREEREFAELFPSLLFAKFG